MNVNKNLMQREEFGKFFLENFPRVKSFARQILVSEADAEDIAQDVFLKLLDMPEVWRNKELINNYLFKMTKNHIFNFIRHKNIERKYQEAVINKNQISHDLGIDEELHAKEIALLMRYTVEKMPERRKKIFRMSRYEGKSNKEISECLDMSVRTVEQHIYLALSDLKKSISFYLPVE